MSCLVFSLCSRSNFAEFTSQSLKNLPEGAEYFEPLPVKTPRSCKELEL
jgi:hypothetical protein